MENKSILDQIITNYKAEEIAKLNAIEIINDIFDKLNERERDILIRRFGLHGKGKETLENIGNIHNLTRERIRQIETTALAKLRKLKDLNERLSGLKKVINELIEEHGGIIERNYLLDNLVNFSVDGVKSIAEEGVHKRYLDFLIAKLLFDEFEEINNSNNFINSFKIKYSSLEHLEQLAEELLAEIKNAKKIFTTEEIINLSKRMDSYQKNKGKFNANNIIDISNIIKSTLYDENTNIINENKIIYSLLKASKHIGQNKFGYWGIYNSKEIKPKTINDKIYLVLKNHGQPMHFVEIADKINKISFDNKKANPATVHNELILDSKYILVGRGLYGLKEWGYKKGTVADIITSILADSQNSLSKEEIINKVLDQRLVKKSTIILSLMNKDKFIKLDGKYKLKE
ncbi:hypothetical protein COX67_01470 [Candidatus Falkowbacteria bacterium CG_4_10_14_0_2_um_filter_36_22]|uniref:HTH HARE-type domain-containing protein n=2 Tax=Candidatus Falkowiibacteriota TaxID=1752728 RepID=A0A1J4TAI9_9BACT|nr:MAG: hypothetical protein AUJ27_01605 [Candidatus Falkowbacteria bacterium CG1_02_37_44]PIV51850.1 MAG: hypothetical protein COS18_01840 [Candidatus Falkowbacteria bacterium CG02_land_8_20_14_3_00_36_14]PJA11109.1 MAG: hypothetical protein COX67_01470 [Candidatus Falkowbacteria bacterium CG_4_10_14_0_2_um_filter_36_22]